MIKRAVTRVTLRVMTKRAVTRVTLRVMNNQNTAKAQPNPNFKFFMFLGHVSCLEFISDTKLLAASGPDLFLYEINGKVLLKTQLFEFERIHQIVCISASRFVARGAKELCLFELVDNFKILYSLKLHDWIQDVCPLEDDELAILFSSNTLQRWRKDTLLNELLCSENCQMSPFLI
jgi:hypothetical protein